MDGLHLAPRPLGDSGLTVPALGLGAGPLGEYRVSDAQAERLLHGALDLGVTLIDTAPSYGNSEERIGRLLAQQRSRYVLSTKCGYGVPGTEDWTAECVRLGIDRALTRLRTDVIDVMHLHSCPRDVLARGDVQRALETARALGKIRVLAYSGENDALDYAIHSGQFGAVQRSVNLADQHGYDALPRSPTGKTLGVLAKRALVNAAWDHLRRPERADVALYWDRLQKLGLDPHGLEPQSYALRFTVFAPGVSCALVGAGSLERLESLVASANEGPLPESVLGATRAAWQRVGRDWPGQI